ncbi:MAG: hypothetical protein IPG16_03220 [Comamonadaceae bacterium]|nr:hypothetical protein [Comamonadaceae bacterium]
MRGGQGGGLLLGLQAGNAVVDGLERLGGGGLLAAHPLLDAGVFFQAQGLAFFGHLLGGLHFLGQRLGGLHGVGLHGHVLRHGLGVLVPGEAARIHGRAQQVDVFGIVRVGAADLAVDLVQQLLEFVGGGLGGVAQLLDHGGGGFQRLGLGLDAVHAAQDARVFVGAGVAGAQDAGLQGVQLFFGAHAVLFDGLADGVEAFDVERGQGHGLRADGADLAADALEHEGHVGAEQDDGLQRRLQPGAHDLGQAVAAVLGLQHDFGQLIERGHQLAGQCGGEALGADLDFFQVVVELGRLAGQVAAENDAQALGLGAKLGHAGAALVQQRDHVGAGLAEQLDRERGFFGAVAEAGELVGNGAEHLVAAAQAAVEVFEADADGLEGGGLLFAAAGCGGHVQAEFADAGGQRLDRGADHLAGVAQGAEGLGGNAGFLAQVIELVEHVDGALDGLHAEYAGGHAAQHAEGGADAAQAGCDGLGIGGQAAQALARAVEGARRLVFGGEDDAGFVIGHGVPAGGYSRCSAHACSVAASQAWMPAKASRRSAPRRPMRSR